MLHPKGVGYGAADGAMINFSEEWEGVNWNLTRIKWSVHPPNQGLDCHCNGSTYVFWELGEGKCHSQVTVRCMHG